MLNCFSSQQQLASQVALWRTSGDKIGFTCGAFDLLHAGHVAYLQKARTLCDRLIVGVNSDGSVRSYKSPLRPIVPEQHRLSLIASLSCVDAAVLMRDARPARMLQELQPDYYIKGGDYRTDQLRSASIVESYGGRCVVVPIEHDISTSAIVRRIEEGAIYAFASESNTRPPSRVVLLDRDGTLIENVPFLKEPGRVTLLEGVGEGLRLLQDEGFALSVVSNQQGLGLGYFDYDDFVAVNSEMLRQLAVFQVRIAKFYFCPHSLADDCGCRKPGTKLIERAMADFGCPPKDCYLMGDSASDLLAAKSAGCQGFLVGRPDASDLNSARLSFKDAALRIMNATATANA